MKKEEGITLIALIVTIIVLLILAGTSIAMLTSENGIINQAQNAKEETEIASEKEAIQLTMINKEMTGDEKYNIGEELRDRTLANGDNWKIVSVNDTKQIYGTDWYYVGTGVSLENYGETKYEWVINYNTGEVIELPEEGFVKLAYGENLAVTEGIILNADPINMGDSNSWGEGVTVYGIEEGDGYGWNETEFKLDGVDDYIEVYPQADVNIENGLTFEFYANSEKEGNIPMLAKTIKNAAEWSGRFRTNFYQGANRFRCCMSSLYSHSDWTEGNGNQHWIYRDLKENFKSIDGSYLTMTADIQNSIITLYWNGEIIGGTSCSHEWMINGGLTDNSIPFTIGLVVEGTSYQEYYAKTNLYACRLYNKVLTSDEVKANYDKTVAYHNLLTK